MAKKEPEAQVASEEEVVDLGDSGQVIEIDVPQEEAPPPLTVDDYAKARGWKPREEWDDTKGEWRPAQEFLDRGLDGKKDVTKELNRLREAQERIGETTARLLSQTEERTRAETAAYWQRQLDEAVEAGDSQAARHAAQNLAPQQAQSPLEHPTVRRWIADNPWYNADPIAQQVATAVTVQNAHLPFDRQLELARTEVLRRFPEYAPKAAEKEITVAQPSNTARPPSKTKTFHDLPVEAQQVARYLAQAGKVTTDAYVAEYFNKEGTVR